MKTFKKLKERIKNIKDLDWKESLFKSIVYRIITLILGFSIALMVTGNLMIAIGVAAITEFVQFINYFIFEIAWTNLRTKKRLEKQLRKKIIDLKINYDSILELAYEMSRISTFVKEIYDSTTNFFTSILENKQLNDLHEPISKYYEHFKQSHIHRDFN